jgi:hypothetical protein
MNLFEEAENLYNRLEKQMSANSFFETARYQLAFLQRDRVGMQRYFDAVMGKPGAEEKMLELKSDTEAYYGHLANAREFSGRAVDSARRSGAQAAALLEAQSALREADFGNSAEAKRKAEAALRMASARDAQVLAALVLARAGDDVQAQRLSERLDREFPLDTLMQSYLLPTIRALLALNRSDWKLALKLLKKTSEYEFALTEAPPLYAAYVRGQSYLNARQGQEAATEFQTILNHSGIVGNFWTGALARLGVARANALQARTSQGADADAARVRALAAYKDFLTLWKDADPDIPILKQAKAEYAKLQ